MEDESLVIVEIRLPLWWYYVTVTMCHLGGVSYPVPEEG